MGENYSFFRPRKSKMRGSSFFGPGRSKNHHLRRTHPSSKKSHPPPRLPSDLRPILQSRRSKMEGFFDLRGRTSKIEDGGLFDATPKTEEPPHLLSSTPKIEEPPIFGLRSRRLGRRSPSAPRWKIHSGQLSSMPWKSRGSVVSWANLPVGVPSCSAPPYTAALPLAALPRPARGMSGFWIRQILK